MFTPLPVPPVLRRPTVTCLNTADQPYYRFVGPRIASALLTVPGAFCELHVSDPEQLWTDCRPVLTRLQQLFPDRFAIHALPARSRGRCPAGVRFLLEPVQRCDYTYLGDIDIVHVDPDLIETHEWIMRQYNRPWSNRVRPGTSQLTGLHMVRTHDWYRPESSPIREQAWNSRFDDEELLYELGTALYGPLTDQQDRPVHGLHLSPNRPDPLGAELPGWNITHEHLLLYAVLAERPEWQELLPLFDERFRQALAQVSAVAVRCQDEPELIRLSDNSPDLAIRRLCPLCLSDQLDQKGELSQIFFRCHQCAATGHAVLQQGFRLRETWNCHA
jgi:hypothetical protein